MSNIFNPSGGTTTVTDLSGNNWKALYTNGSGTVTELALGADGTTLVGNGTSSAPTFGNLTDLKGGNDKVLFTNSSGVLTELAIGATGTFLKSAGTTSNPTWAAPSSANWSQIATGTQSAGSATIIDISSLSNYEALRGRFVSPLPASGDSSINWTVNGLTGNYYRNMSQKWLGNALSSSGVWTGTYAGSSWNGDYAYVQFEIYFLAQSAGAASKGTIAGTFNIFSPLDQSAAFNGSWDQTHFNYSDAIDSDTGLTALNIVMGASNAQTASGYTSFFVEGYTAS